MKGKGLFGGKKSDLWLLKIYSDAFNKWKKKEIYPYVRTYFWVTIKEIKVTKSKDNPGFKRFRTQKNNPENSE